jgi:hypothetical protein
MKDQELWLKFSLDILSSSVIGLHGRPGQGFFVFYRNFQEMIGVS